MGEFKKAEQLLEKLIQEDPENVWHYIAHGDLYYFWQVLPEKQDLHRAESWYYKAFEQKLGANTEDGLDLLERLGDVCIERLKRHSQKKLLELLEFLHIGRWMVLDELKRTVYLSDSDSVVLNHLELEISKQSKNIEQANCNLGILMNAYNLMPQKDLNGLCPFQMAEYYYQGEHSPRIIQEKMEAMQQAVSLGQLTSPVKAESAEAFSSFKLILWNK